MYGKSVKCRKNLNLLRCVQRSVNEAFANYFTGQSYLDMLTTEGVASGVPEGDFVAGDKTKPYFVALDTKGELGWEFGRFANKGRVEAHVIEILTEAAPLSYRAYLRKRRVSYITAGKTELDCEMAMEKLYRLFGIEKLLVCGGGAVDWTFLQAGMVDELSMVLSPVTDGSSGTASVFTQIPGVSEGSPIEFTLKAVERIGEGGLYLTYLAKDEKQNG